MLKPYLKNRFNSLVFQWQEDGSRKFPALFLWSGTENIAAHDKYAYLLQERLYFGVGQENRYPDDDVIFWVSILRYVIDIHYATCNNVKDWDDLETWWQAESSFSA